MKKFIRKLMVKIYYYLFWVLTGVKKVPSSPNNTIKYIFPNGDICGVFYDSFSKKKHLALYVPYRLPPNVYLCGGKRNFSASAKEDNICTICYEQLFSYCKLKSLAKFVFRKIIR